MNDENQSENRYYIQAHSSQISEQSTRIIKHNGTFGVFNSFGDIIPLGLGQQGLYYESSRFISRFELKIENEYPLLLSSTVKEDNSLITVDLTNPDISTNEKIIISKGSLHIHRTKFILQKCCYEAVNLTNFSNDTHQVSLSLLFISDFADIFEIRGMERKKKGHHLPAQVENDRVLHSYMGLDNVKRTMEISFEPRPQSLYQSGATFQCLLGPKESETFYIRISYGADEEPLNFNQALKNLVHDSHQAKSKNCKISTSNAYFNEWMGRSLSDLHMLMTHTPYGPYPYAGIPWYCNVFGRDGLITALQMLWVNPDIAKGVLSYLAANQAKVLDPARDAEPGKILHEARVGEMAATGEVPFQLYYGSIDSTPLFIVLAGHYYQMTGNLDFMREIWPNIKLALQWIDQYGDRDQDGFVEYYRESSDGLINQGWKDSHDSVFYHTGQLAQGSIALCEVQSYVYDAKMKASELAYILGEESLGQKLHREARDLQERFEKLFWSEELSSYVLALDGEKRQCKVLSSNAGHCLMSGIASIDRARKVANNLFKKSMFSGHGIRTLAASEMNYNPMSYHNGSIWPHDNGLIALGLARYGLKGLIAKLLSGLFDVANAMDLYRLPELFCGFSKRGHEGPTLYPVACVPQAWSSVTVFSLLQATLGLRMDAPHKRIYFHSPFLPKTLDRIEMHNLRLGPISLDLSLHRHAYDVGILINKRSDECEIIIVK